ncbi:MAG: hypothetical protein ACYDBB_10475 [Armatimonadota bacterium]
MGTHTSSLEMIERQSHVNASVIPWRIERSHDPNTLSANLLDVAGIIALQWGEEILLHLRVASLWHKIGKQRRAVEYLQSIAAPPGLLQPGRSGHMNSA